MDSAEKRRRHAEAQRRWRESHPETAKAQIKRYHDKRAALGLARAPRRPETVRAQRARYYAKNKASVRARQNGRNYGITPAEYAERRSRPCAICGVFKDEPGKRGSGMHIDHDHATGQLRGTLCDRCNRGVGMFDDRVELLTRAAAYLSEWAK